MPELGEGQHQEVRIKSEEEGIQEIVEHLRGAELESARFQAFADYADWQNELAKENGDVKIINETIRQRKNGMREYKKEYDQLPKVIGPYIRALRNTLSNEPFNKGFNPLERHSQIFVATLQNIKDQEIDKRSQQSPTPPEK